MKIVQTKQLFSHPEFQVLWIGGQLQVIRHIENPHYDASLTWILDEYKPTYVTMLPKQKRQEKNDGR